MLFKIIVVFALLLACFPLGRKVLAVLFSFVASVLGASDSSDNSGPHYDHYSGEVHAYKEHGGMYDSD